MSCILSLRFFQAGWPAVAAVLVPIVADLVDTPLNVALKLLAKPPALGFGKEKLVLDNSFVSVDYENKRFTHTNKGESKSVAHPVESSSLSL